MFVLLGILLASLVWMFAVRPAEDAYRGQASRRRALQDQLQREREETRRLEILKSGLENDPQTVERALRATGFGRPGDLGLAMPTRVAPAGK